MPGHDADCHDGSWDGGAGYGVPVAQESDGSQRVCYAKDSNNEGGFILNPLGGLLATGQCTEAQTADLSQTDICLLTNLNQACPTPQPTAASVAPSAACAAGTYNPAQTAPRVLANNALHPQANT